jgi:predicted nuclease with RNAse H fold
LNGFGVLKGSNVFVGLDPSAGDKNPSGIAIINETGVVLHLGVWMMFRELPQILGPFQEKILIIAIDGPLQPPGELNYCCFSDAAAICHYRQTTPYKGRYAEYLLNRNGFRCFTTSRQSFAWRWISRCFELNEYVKGLGYQTIEAYPTAARKILFPGILGSKKLLHNRKKLQEDLKTVGIIVPPSLKIYSDHELDAVLAAYTALLEHNCNALKIGNVEDGFIIIPQIKLKYRS